MKTDFSNDARKIVGNVSLDSPHGCDDAARIHARHEDERGQIETIRWGEVTASFGQTNAVSLHFYAKESDWENRAPDPRQLIAGFRRTPNEAVTLGSEHALNRR